LTILAIVAGLQFGPFGVVLAISGCSLLVQMPITLYLAGRSGPVRTAQLWGYVMRQVPYWAAIFSATYLTRSLLTNQPDWLQLLICPIAGMAAGAAVVLGIPSSRKRVVGIVEIGKESLLKRSLPEVGK
jgi:hypothetical protein